MKASGRREVEVKRFPRKFQAIAGRIVRSGQQLLAGRLSAGADGPNSAFADIDVEEAGRSVLIRKRIKKPRSDLLRDHSID